MGAATATATAGGGEEGRSARGGVVPRVVPRFPPVDGRRAGGGAPGTPSNAEMHGALGQNRSGLRAAVPSAERTRAEDSEPTSRPRHLRSPRTSRPALGKRRETLGPSLCGTVRPRRLGAGRGDAARRGSASAPRATGVRPSVRSSNLREARRRPRRGRRRRGERVARSSPARRVASRRVAPARSRRERARRRARPRPPETSDDVGPPLQWARNTIRRAFCSTCNNSARAHPHRCTFPSLQR